jgi:hypothetical protein
MKIKFQADEDLNQNIVNAVIRISSKIDFQTAFSADLKGLKDREVLALTASQKRILVSHDHEQCLIILLNLLKIILVMAF